jgi:hypothetical protein
MYSHRIQNEKKQNKRELGRRIVRGRVYLREARGALDTRQESGD